MQFDAQHGNTAAIFGKGCVEARLPEAIRTVASDAKGVLVVCSPRGQQVLGPVVKALPLAATFCTEVVQHVPQPVIDQAVTLAKGADVQVVIGFGGGSAIGLGKAVALSLNLPLIAIPTNYSGSEMTDILGVTTAEGGKKTQRDAAIRPRIVLYDPIYTLGLPLKASVESGWNACAHAVEALWSRKASPPTLLLAEEGVRVLADAIPLLQAVLKGEGGDEAALRETLLYGSYLCGVVLQDSSMAIHHKCCHVLGGSLGLPHGSVHSAMLAFSVAFNRDHAPAAMDRIRRALGLRADADIASEIFERVRASGATYALRMLEGFKPESIDMLTAKVVEGGALYDNPRPIEPVGVSTMLMDAYLGRRPTAGNTRSLDYIAGAQGPHAAMSATLGGCPIESADACLVCVHGRFSSSDRMIFMMQSALGSYWKQEKVSYVAIQAADATWYPDSFLKPRAENEPKFGSAVSALVACLETVLRVVPPSRVILCGFSQGACLTLSTLAQRGANGVAAVIGLSGGLAGSEAELETLYKANLAGTRVVLGCAAADGHVPLARVHTTSRRLRALGSDVQDLIFDGSEHGITEAEAVAIRSILTPMLTQLHGADRFKYLRGFGNVHTSEARPGAVPPYQTSPADSPYGLYPEVITASSFVAPRSTNFRTVFYRIHPTIGTHSKFKPLEHPRFTTNPSAHGFRRSPEPLRWVALPLPDKTRSVDFIDGLSTVAGSGDSMTRSGAFIHTYACNASMTDRAFYNADGDLCLVPQLGELIILTECGRLHAAPGELVVLPRGLKFSVELVGEAARGWVCESVGQPFKLPDRGPLGTAGLADERHFAVPTAWYEDRKVEGYRLTTKFGGELSEATLAFSPFDVVGWTGQHYPCKYNLHLFQSVGSVTWDHSDPSIHTVLSAPADTLGNNACDIAAFMPRWDPTLHTFRPPWYHRNQATEYNAIVKMSGSYSGFVPGGSFYTPFYSGHGTSTSSVVRMSGQNSAPAHTSPDESSVWVMFESCFQMMVAPWAAEAEHIDQEYRGIYTDLPRAYSGTPKM